MIKYQLYLNWTMENKIFQKKKKNTKNSNQKNKSKRSKTKSQNKPISILKNNKNIKPQIQNIYNHYFQKSQPKKSKQKIKTNKDPSKKSLHRNSNQYFPSTTQYPLSIQKTNTQNKQQFKKYSQTQINSKNIIKNSIGKLINIPNNKNIINQTKTTNNTNQQIRLQQSRTHSLQNSLNFFQCQQINQSMSNKSTNNQTIIQCAQFPKDLQCKQQYLKNNIDNQGQKILDKYILAHIGQLKQISSKYMKNKTQLTQKMRRQTIDWLFSLAQQIQVKRQTMHLAIMYLDLYLNKYDVKKNQLQLVAIGCFIIAFKLQQKIPMNFIDIFQSNSPKGFSKQKIIQMQLNIVLNLKFRIRKVTYIFWIQTFTYQWDSFIDQPKIISLSIIHDNVCLMSHSLKFRNLGSIHMFCNVSQLIDTAIYNLEIYNFEKCKVVLSCIYLIARVQVQNIIEGGEHKYRLYYQKYKGNTNPIFLDKYGFNELFCEFLLSYNLELTDIIQATKFIAQYLDFNFNKIDLQSSQNLSNIIHTHQYNQTILYYINNKL